MIRGLYTYRVGSDVNVLLLAVLDQVVALENGVALDLVGGGDDTGAVDEGLELFRVSIVASHWAAERRTCSILWLETPTARALVLGSLVMASLC